jgi:hypothetical protein
MIRLAHCVRKRDDISLQDFRYYWQSPEFDQLLERMANFFGARRYAKNATLAVDANLWVKEMRNCDAPFDGVIEYWWDNAAQVMDLALTEPFHVLRTEMELFQWKFMALERSVIFFTEGDQIER